MIVHKIAAGALAGALSLGLLAGPVVAKGKPDDKGSKSKVKGTTSVMFTKSVKTKLVKAGITVEAVEPGTKKNKVKFTFPATQTEPRYITHAGGLTFTRGKDKSLTITDFSFDLQDKVVDVTVGVDVVEAFTLSKVKINKKTITARLNLATGTAAVLNDALDTSVFKDGMFFAKSNSKF